MVDENLPYLLPRENLPSIPASDFEYYLLEGGATRNYRSKQVGLILKRPGPLEQSEKAFAFSYGNVSNSKARGSIHKLSRLCRILSMMAVSIVLILNRAKILYPLKIKW